MAKKVKKQKPDALRINDQIWPMERAVLFRPERYQYVRKLIKPSGCVFCFADKQEISLETLCVFKSKHSMILLNKYPYNSGHLLIMPRKHGGHILGLSEKAYVDLFATQRLAIKALESLYQPSGFNMGLNHGSVSGAGIPDHLHFHLIPRWAGDLNFFPLVAETKVLIESLPETYQRFLSYFKKI
jgi:ATP adenylyltransferase